MADKFKNFTENIWKLFVELPPRNRFVLIFAVMLTLATLAGMVMWANKVDYKTLYTNISPQDAGTIISRLKAQKIPFKAGADGTSIMVPAGKVYELRMELAGEGLPQSGGIGYEIFDQQSIGVTEFEQRINFKRALQGELARTINQFSEVKSTRVHLTIPEKSLFSEGQVQPSASIVLTLYSGHGLKSAQIQGITHLVASSVESLEPDDVVIVDSNGKLLAGGKERFEHTELTLSQQNIRSSVEREIERKIESMLGNVVGLENLNAKVSVEMDFTQVEQTEESFDPDTAAVRSEQRTTEKSAGRRPLASGIPGVASNTPDIKAAAGGQTQAKTTNYNKSDETINYEISRVTKRVVNQIGTTSRLSAAVLIDGTYVTEEDEDGNKARKYVPRSAEEMKKYTALVKKAVGFDEDRGDSVEVVNVQFKEAVTEDVAWQQKYFGSIDLGYILKYTITAILFAIFCFFGLKPFYGLLTRTVEIRAERSTRAELTEGGGFQVKRADGEELSPGAFADPLSEKQNTLLGFAQKNPRLFAQYLKNWLQ